MNYSMNAVFFVTYIKKQTKNPDTQLVYLCQDHLACEWLYHKPYYLVFVQLSTVKHGQ